MLQKFLATTICTLAITTFGVGKAGAACGQTGEYQMNTGDALSAEQIAKMNLQEATQKLGVPATEMFQLSGNVSEFRIELLNCISKDDLAQNPPQITEATWKVASDQMLTVWYQDAGDGLIYLHHMIWDAGQEF